LSLSDNYIFPFALSSQHIHKPSAQDIYFHFLPGIPVLWKQLTGKHPYSVLTKRSPQWLFQSVY